MTPEHGKAYTSKHDEAQGVTTFYGPSGVRFEVANLRRFDVTVITRALNNAFNQGVFTGRGAELAPAPTDAIGDKERGWRFGGRPTG